MLSNSLVAGMLTAAYVLVLVLQLNPTLALAPRSLAPLVLTVGVFYAVHLTAIAYFLLVVRQLFGRELFSPAWTSVRVITWLGVVASATGALVMWANVRTFALVMETSATQALVNGAIVLAATAVLLLATAVTQQYGGSRRAWAAWVGAIAATSVALPLAFRMPASPSPLDARPLGDLGEVPPADGVGRVTVVALDAGSLELITNATTEGRLPNFGRILDGGAVAHLATLHPTSAEAVWAAIATGKLPQKNGVRSAAVYRLANRPDFAIQLLPDFCFANGLIRFGILREEPRTSASIRSRTLWAILSAAGIDVGVVNFPLTYPAPAVRGYVVSDAYMRVADTATDLNDPTSVYPPSLQSAVAQALQRPDEETMPVKPVLIATVGLVWMGFTGFLDDYLKVIKKQSEGFKPRYKLAMQLVFALGLGMLLHFDGSKQSVWVPVAATQVDLGWVYLPFVMLVVIGASNAVNLTDGLDGLAAGVVIVVALSYAAIAYISGRTDYSAHLTLPHIVNGGELAVFCTAMAGACVGFLWHNSNPATIFMGDTGSLALGGAIGVVAILIKQELLLVMIGGIFVIEALSVIIQVASYKLRDKKKVFKMAPIHHHFELSGWAEPKVVIRFWIVTLMLALSGLSLLGLNRLLSAGEPRPTGTGACRTTVRRAG